MIFHLDDESSLLYSINYTEKSDWLPVAGNFPVQAHNWHSGASWYGINNLQRNLLQAIENKGFTKNSSEIKADLRQNQTLC